MTRRLIASGLLLMILVGGCGSVRQVPAPGDTKPAVAAPSRTRSAPAHTPPAQASPQPAPSVAPPAAHAANPGPRCTAPSPAAESRYITVLVYFSCEDDPDQAHPVLRQVPATSAVLEAALTELLKGPTAAEKAAGFRSWFSSETAGMLREVRIHDGMAHVDFKNFQHLMPNASASAGSSQLLDELGRTIFQFKEVKQADVRFDGSCQAFWGWLQRDCQLMEPGRYRQQK